MRIDQSPKKHKISETKKRKCITLLRRWQFFNQRIENHEENANRQWSWSRRQAKRCLKNNLCMYAYVCIGSWHGREITIERERSLLTKTLLSHRNTEDAIWERDLFGDKLHIEERGGENKVWRQPFLRINSNRQPNRSWGWVLRGVNGDPFPSSLGHNSD